jgi:hypothetical protein
MSFIGKLYERLEWLGIRPSRILAALRELRRYSRDYRAFSSKQTWQIVKHPYLFDRYQGAGSLGEYFFQDLYVARQVIELNPRRHIDVGSRIDGFAAHLACVREVEVLDIRPSPAAVDGISFWQVDISRLGPEWHGVADCASCLHALEHFGLGRYGDDLDPDGWIAGLAGLQAILAEGGILWLSVPVGMERVEFNAHRVFNPWTIHRQAEALGLSVEEFAFLAGPSFIVSENRQADYERLSHAHYSLALFKLKKGSVSSSGP